jgi:hypothetical protein
MAAGSCLRSSPSSVIGPAKPDRSPRHHRAASTVPGVFDTQHPLVLFRPVALLRTYLREVGSGLALPPVWDAGRIGLEGAQVGDELADLLVGQLPAEVQAPGRHAAT